MAQGGDVRIGQAVVVPIDVIAHVLAVPHDEPGVALVADHGHPILVVLDRVDIMVLVAFGDLVDKVRVDATALVARCHVRFFGLELEKGDPFYIKVMGNTLAYRVNDIRIVSPTDTKALKIRKGRDEVTLLTCTGQGNTLRLLVTGERNSMPDQAPLPGASPGDTKQAALVSGVTVTGVLAVGFSLCRSRRVSGRHMSC